MTMRIEVTGWANYNPRHDLKHVPWVRIESNIATSRKLFSLTAEEKWFWIYLLTLAGEQNKNGQIDATLDYLAHFSGLSKPHALKALENIEACGLIEVDRVNQGTRTDPIESVRDPNGSVPNGRDGRDGTDDNYMSASPTPTELAETWNELRSPKQTAINLKLFKPKSKRWIWAASRLMEHPDPNYWREVVTRIAKSDFCNGANERGWVADFEFLVRSETHIKALEGKYDNRSRENAAPSAGIRTRLLAPGEDPHGPA